MYIHICISMYIYIHCRSRWSAAAPCGSLSLYLAAPCGSLSLYPAAPCGSLSLYLAAPCGSLSLYLAGVVGVQPRPVGLSLSI